MATIDQIKTQLQNANTLGLTNLAAKGVSTTNLDTTYKIMEAIASITGGGGDSSGGSSFVPLDEKGTGFYWNGDTTGITDVVTVLNEHDTNIAFYKVLSIEEDEDPDLQMYNDFIFSVGPESENLFRIIPTITSDNNAIWSMEGTPLMAYIVDATKEVSGITFPAKGLYFIKITMSEGGQTVSIYTTVAISGAMLKFYYEEDSDDTMTITWDEDTDVPVLDMDGTSLYLASNKLMSCALVGGNEGMSMFSYEVTLSDNTTKTVFPIVYFFDGYNIIAFTDDMESEPAVISAFAPNAGLGKITVPQVGTYFATGYKAITATSLMGS